MADVFAAGYGQMWVPPPEKAGLSGSNVGYEVFDRFDLGSPESPTLYGTEARPQVVHRGGARGGRKGLH